METTKFFAKSLPVDELEVVGMIYVAHQGGEVVDDYEYYNKTLADTSAFGPFEHRCECCGQRLKWACEVVHRPTHTGFHVGRACASKIESLNRYSGLISTMSVALAERAACAKREADFRAARPETNVALDWAKVGPNKIAADMLAKLRRWGSLSDNQVSFLLNLHAEDTARRAAATGICPTGRVELVGKIVSIKDRPEEDRYGTVHHWKMVLDLGNGVRVWGTCPEAIAPAPYGSTDGRAKVGDTISLTATVEPKDGDPLFGFFARPAKATLNHA